MSCTSNMVTEASFVILPLAQQGTIPPIVARLYPSDSFKNV
ncbi:hypothetical protein [Saliterribacillus persicus]|uniref:Uncharacterized protein n=1 Tax=Saliterribacillus persicus TaxID=930114 RepID=A0A368Y0M7_9BACI|nr:hypothetical protein [Saliterribacillus persicus]RCW73249.1 hypothetical protein DFR57_104247 [Saliterribacillus persicus]